MTLRALQRISVISESDVPTVWGGHLTPSKKVHEFFGYRIIQNPANEKLTMYMGGVDAQILRDVVSVDNAVGWDTASKIWREGGRNRTIDEGHWRSIEEFLESGNNEGILPAAIVISVRQKDFEFEPLTKMKEVNGVVPGLIRITGYYDTDSDGTVSPVEEASRSAWVLDGQHRIKAFRDWSMPDPYPVNVTIIRAWDGNDYEDVMRHQTYELNMGRPLSDDFKAAVREQYDRQLGHKAYRSEIACSWIRKDIEGRGQVFSANGIVGATNLRTPYVITMSFVEKLIKLAFDSDSYLNSNFFLDKMDMAEVSKVGRYLFNFFEGVRLSIGLINPNTKGTIGTEPEVDKAVDYWDIATDTKHKQRLLHNVGLKALVRGLLNPVMRSDVAPDTPQKVAHLLDHMRGIPWHDPNLQSKKDDWVVPLADALKTMFKSKGTSGGKQYHLKLVKKNAAGNEIDSAKITAFGWK